MTALSHANVIALFRRVGEMKLCTEANFINCVQGDPSIDWLQLDVDVRDDGPCVYLWVEEPFQSAPLILYIGKAGSTLAMRCRQHAQGFRGANRGKSHADALIPRIRAGSRIGIYGLWPDPVPFAQKMIPSHSSVEDWLIAVTTPRPERNR